MPEIMCAHRGRTPSYPEDALEVGNRQTFRSEMVYAAPVTVEMQNVWIDEVAGNAKRIRWASNLYYGELDETRIG